MIKYEIKKINPIVLYTVFGIAFIALLGATILFMKNSSLNVSANAKYYDEITEYSEEEYNTLIDKRAEVVERLFATEDKNLKEQIREEFSEVSAKISMYKNIYNRRFNVQVFTTYQNWESSLKYSYDTNETYSIANTSMWSSLFKYPLYEYVAIMVIVILSIIIYTSDNKEGNRKVIYQTYKGGLSIRVRKRLLTYIGTVAVTVGCFATSFIVSICMGLDIKLVNIGLYHLDEFPFAPSYMCIGDYLLYMILGHIIFNLMIVAFIDMITSLIDKKVFITIISVLFIVLLAVFSEDMWINPITMLNPSYYFDNVREITIGNYVVHHYLVTNAIMVLLIVLFGLFAKLMQILRVETE